METKEKIKISVQVSIHAPIEKIWKCWTSPEDIICWNNASDDWHTVRAENDLRRGGKFSFRMEARDGSTGFNFDGVYDEVITLKQIGYTISDGRKVKIIFLKSGDEIKLIEVFEAEDYHTAELQRSGWQAILNNFRKHVETAGS
jgi:uncharacterized protein YndB with AHSA1/START domain